MLEAGATASVSSLGGVLLAWSMGIKGTQTYKGPHLVAGLGTRCQCKKHPRYCLGWHRSLGCAVGSRSDGRLPPALLTCPSFHAMGGEQRCLSTLQPPHLPGSAVLLVGAHPSKKPSAPLGLQVIPEYQEPTPRCATRCHLSSAAPVTERLYQASGCRRRFHEKGRRPAFRSFCSRHRIDDNTSGTGTTMLLLKMDQRMLTVKVHQAVK